MHLTSYVKNSVSSHTSDGRDYLTVQDVGMLKGAYLGRGMIYSRTARLERGAWIGSDFDMSQVNPTTYVAGESGSITLEREPRSEFPCSGIISSTGEGYVIGPAYELDPVKGQSIVLMLLAARTTPYNVSTEKSVLAIPKEESQVSLTSLGGEVRCLGTISSRSKIARITLNRNPELRELGEGFNETLSELRGGGMLTLTWKPVTRAFEELVIAFYPSRMFSDDVYSWGLDRIASNLGAPGPLDDEKPSDYVIGDGSEVHYTLRLTTDRGLGRHDSDETRLTVT
jgi:hypothetical protein